MSRNREGTWNLDDTYIDLDNAWGFNLLYHELGNAITFFNWARPVHQLSQG
jgi:hypothetical protein